MRPISPDLGGDPVVYAEEQLEYSPLPAEHVVTDVGPVIATRFRLTEDERSQVAAGEDLYILFLAGRVSPMHLSIGRPG